MSVSSFDTTDNVLPDDLRDLIDRLHGIAAPFPDANGGGYWDSEDRRFVYRVVDGALGSTELRDGLDAAIRAEGNPTVPVVIESTPVSTSRLQAAADRLNGDRFWAHPYEDDVFRVTADRYRNMLRISVGAHPDEIAQRAARAAGIDAYARVSSGPGGPLVLATPSPVAPSPTP